MDQKRIYCVVPAELAERLHDPLRRHFADDPQVEVVVERRRTDRRARADRRKAGSAPDESAERRRIRSDSGRRIAERRATAVAVPTGEAPSLPRRFRRDADQIAFVERVVPSGEAAEDVGTARLVLRIQAGESELFSEIYTRYFDRVYGYLRAILRDRHEAEDAVQEVFADVLEALPRYVRREQPFRAWMFAIARHSALSRLRRNRRVELAEDDSLVPEDEPDERPASGLGLDTLDWISDNDLLLFVDRLSVTQRQVLVLRYALGLRLTEIAEVLGLKPEAVRMQHSRGIRFLRQRLEAVGRRSVRSTGSARRSPALTPLRQARVVRLRRFALTAPGPTG